MNMITAHEAQAQGSGPSLFLSIAKVNPPLANEARRRARELADLLGLDMGGRLVKGGGKPSNDNRGDNRRSRRHAA